MSDALVLGPIQVILDTNIFVAAGFKRQSQSAQLLQQVRDRQLQMVWHQLTRQETKYIINKIPPLSWGAVEELFCPQWEYTDPLDLDAFQFVEDLQDRKFAALCHASGIPLITMDRGLLGAADTGALPIMNPKDFARDYRR